MTFVETSAFVEVMLRQPEAGRIRSSWKTATKCMTGAHVRLETCMVVSSRLKVTTHLANAQFQALLDEVNIQVLPFTDEIAEAALVAFDKYGKGRNAKTALNLADCMSYAFAKTRNLKILFTGTDFKGTDLKAA
jgi:ribonuclease VapC